jgi:hypothetical protein
MEGAARRLPRDDLLEERGLLLVKGRLQAAISRTETAISVAKIARAMAQVSRLSLCAMAMAMAIRAQSPWSRITGPV